MKALELKVKGRVQRVGYRRYLLDLGQELGLAGYAKNEKDGSVTVLVQGSEEKLKEFLKRARAPPRPAIIKELVERSVEPDPAIKYFEIKPGKPWEEMSEGFGAMQSIFMDYWEEFRDYRNEFRNYREEFRDYRNEFREFAKRTDENFRLLMERYGEISEKLTIILNTLIEESRRTREMLEVMRKEFNETRESLTKAIQMLADAIQRLK